MLRSAIVPNSDVAGLPAPAVRVIPSVFNLQLPGKAGKSERMRHAYLQSIANGSSGDDALRLAGYSDKKTMQKSFRDGNVLARLGVERQNPNSSNGGSFAKVAGAGI